MSLFFAISDAGPEQLDTSAFKSTDDIYAALDLGVYSSLRTFEQNKFLDLAQHIARTVRSMELLGWHYRLDEMRLRRALHEVCTAAPFNEMRVRFDVLDAPAAALGSTSRELIALSPFSPPPPALYQTGVHVALAEQIERSSPLIKTADFVLKRKAYEEMDSGEVEQEIYERLLVDPNGHILEGFSSNFYGVRSGIIYTAGEGILEGVTRKILLRLAEENGVPVCFEPVSAAEIGSLDEVAISSSSRGWLPVSSVGSTKYGAPGLVSRTMMKAYEEFLQKAVQTAI